jgi:hypothetical protein
MLEARSNGKIYVQFVRESFASSPAHEEVISFRVLGQLAGNSTAAREKRHANAIQIGTMLRTCEVRVSGRERGARGMTFP